MQIFVAFSEKLNFKEFTLIFEDDFWMLELIFPEPQNIQELSFYHTLQGIQFDIENMEKRQA